MGLLHCGAFGVISERYPCKSVRSPVRGPSWGPYVSLCVGSEYIAILDWFSPPLKGRLDSRLDPTSDRLRGGYAGADVLVKAP